MKTKFQRFLSLTLGAVLAVGSVFALASCGKNYAANNTEFFIGCTGPLTGDAASYGTSVRNGASIAIAEINAAGGLNGVKFKFDMKDDTADATKAKNGYTALYEAGMQASIGSVTSGSCVSFATAAQADGVFAITPSASAEDVIEAGDKIFRVCFSDPQQGVIAADELTKKYQKVGVVYDTSDTYSAGLYDAFEAQMTKLNKTKGTDYVVTSFTADTNKDFAQQITSLKNADCDVIFLPIYYTEAGLIAKAAAAQSFNVPVFGCDGLDSVKDQLDATVTAPVSYITPFDATATDAKTVAFVSAYQAQFGAIPNQFAADAYDAVMVIYEAMKKADVKDVTISAADLGKILADTVASSSFSYTGLTGAGMTWEASGSCNKQPNIVDVQR